MPTALRCESCHERIVRTNQRALAKTLRSLTLGPEFSALIAHAKTLASLIDGFPYETKLHSEYREVLKRLIESGRPKEVGALDKLVEAILAGSKSSTGGTELADPARR